MAESESKNEKPKEERRFDPELLKKGLRCDLDQYERLKNCSERLDEGIAEWNKWRNSHIDEDIFLEGANLSLFYLSGAYLNTEVLYDAHTGQALEFHGKVHLKDAHLESAILEGASLFYTHLESAGFNTANMKSANLRHAYLESAVLEGAHLEGANLLYADLQGASFVNAVVDESTVFWWCEVDRYTNFRGVSLDIARIAPGTKQLLEHNNRQMRWEEWYKEHPRLKWLVKPFWLMSDYGLSTGRIIFTFFGLAIIFANIYYYWGAVDYYILRVNGQPGFVENLFVYGNGIEVQWWLVPLRTLYFSIVTMTTLGFGDMYANAQSIWGHILLSVQVILGYVLLGALITRFAVLFTAGGPAGKFTDEKEKETKESESE